MGQIFCTERERAPFTVARSRARAAILYINRDRDEARRVALEQNLASAKLDAIRIKAVEGRDLPKEIAHLFPPSALKHGEVGCYGSHLMAWRHIVENDLPYALVLEDDAAVGPDFGSILDEVLAVAPAGWDFIHMALARQRACRPLVRLSGGRTLVRFSRVPASTRGYLISNAGARKLLKPVSRMFPVDLDTRRPWMFGLDAYGIVKAPVGGRASESTISPIPGAGRSRLRRGLRMPNPLHSVGGMIFNIEKLGLAWWLRCLAINILSRGDATAMNVECAATARPTPLRAPSREEIRPGL